MLSAYVFFFLAWLPFSLLLIVESTFIVWDGIWSEKNKYITHANLKTTCIITMYYMLACVYVILYTHTSRVFTIFMTTVCLQLL